MVGARRCLEHLSFFKSSDLMRRNIDLYVFKHSVHLPNGFELLPHPAPCTWPRPQLSVSVSHWRIARRLLKAKYRHRSQGKSCLLTIVLLL